MLHEAVDSVLKATTGLVAQIVIVDDGSDNLETLSILDTLEENSNLEIVRLSKNS
jgi:glycosyltransferase involved in cell wall biosynthesis